MTVQVPFLVATIRPTFIVRSFRSGRARSRDAPVGPFLVSCASATLYVGVLRSVGCLGVERGACPSGARPMLAACKRADACGRNACSLQSNRRTTYVCSGTGVRRTGVRRTGVRVAGDSARPYPSPPPPLSIDRQPIRTRRTASVCSFVGLLLWRCEAVRSVSWLFSVLGCTC